MLYDPKWEKPEVKAEPFTLAHIAAWIDTMPANKTYDWCNSGGCGVAQYLMAHGKYPHETDALRANGVNWIGIFCGGNWPRDTFGEASERAHKFLAEQS